MLPDSLQKFIDLFSALPSLGPRQATRLAFYIIRQGRGAVSELTHAIAGLGGLKPCAQCFFPYNPQEVTLSSAKGLASNNNLCPICSNPERRQNVIAIVEKETDLMSLEKTKKFTGRYLILGEISKDGVLESEQKLRLNNLKSFIQKKFKQAHSTHSTSSPQGSSGQAGQAEEIIIALNPTTLGDMEAGLIVQELKPLAKRITRLGRGLPTGGEIEFADEDTLGGALDNRRQA